jgi:hypothetical protein
LSSSSSQANKKKEKHKEWKIHIKEKKCKEGRELTYLFLLLHLGWNSLLAFSSPHSFNIELYTFLKPCVSRLFEALWYSNSGTLPNSSVSCLFKALCYSSLGTLPNSRDGVSGKWGEGGRKGEIGRKGGK